MEHDQQAALHAASSIRWPLRRRWTSGAQT
jgi:hypothetical protein